MPTTEIRPPTAVRKAIRRLAGTTKTLAVAILAAREQIAAIQANADLTHEAQQRQMTEERDRLRGVADDVETTATEAFSEIEAVAMASEDGADPTAALLHENRLQRAWSRVRELLERTNRDPINIATDAQKAGDRLVFEAMREELPTWLQASGDGEREIEQIMIAVGKLEEPLRTPEEQAMADALGRAKHLGEFARMNASTVRLDMETTSQLVRETEDGKGYEVVSPDELSTAP